MRVAVLYRPRRVSYDADWLDALAAAFDADLVDIRADSACEAMEAIVRADLVALMHSTNEQVPDLPDWASAAVKNRRGRAIWFMANEFRDFDAKKMACATHSVDWIASMLPIDKAYEIYGERVVAMPHALNPKIFRSVVPREARPHALGYRGTTYPTGLGDQDRRHLVALASRVWGADIKEGGQHFLRREAWAAALNSWRATVATESGMAGAKCLSSRHLDAIGTQTVQIMPRGRFNGVLGETHYVPCDLSSDGLARALEIAEADGDEIAERALVHVMDTHTYAHRAAEIEALMC